MPLDRSRINPKPLTPYPRRVTLVLPRIALRADLGTSGGTLTRWPRPSGRPSDRPLEIVGVCNDCTGRSLRPPMIATRDRWSLQRLRRPMICLTDQASRKRSALRLESHFPHTRVRACVRTCVM